MMSRARLAAWPLSLRLVLTYAVHLALVSIAALTLAACSGRPLVEAKPATASANALPRTGSPIPLRVGLAPTRLKRQVYVEEHGQGAAYRPVSLPDGRGGAGPDPRRSALRAALERALLQSGRYDVLDGPGPDNEAIRMSVELTDAAGVTTVQLHLHDPRSSAPTMTFSGEGETLPRKDASRTDEATARNGALAFAVEKALRNASAVLGSLPWQAPVLKATDDDKVLIPDGRRLGLKPGVVLSIQTRERVLQGVRAPVAVPGRLVGEVRIVGHEEAPGRETMAVGEIVSGSLKGYDPRELVVRFCKPKGYFGHDFGHDRQCGTKAAALVSFDPETALLSFSPEAEDEAEFHPVPHEASPVERPSAVF